MKLRSLCLLLATSLLLTVAAVASDSTGATIYHERCARCHGADGSGKTTAAAKMNIPNLRSKAIQGLTDEQLYDTIAEGKKHKEYPHAFLYTGLNQAQIKAVVAYIRTLK